MARRLLTAANLLASCADRIAQPAGLTSSRWLLLAELARYSDPPTIGTLSHHLHQSTQNVSRMLSSMQDEGLVERYTQTGWGRAVFVRCTQQGIDALRKTQELARELEHSFLRGFNEPRIETMCRELESLIENLSTLDHQTSDKKAHT
jgi:MarR family transcriptional regulator, organic hydroperoxide resistance regulator